MKVYKMKKTMIMLAIMAIFLIGCDKLNTSLWVNKGETITISTPQSTTVNQTNQTNVTAPLEWDRTGTFYYISKSCVLIMDQEGVFALDSGASDCIYKIRQYAIRPEALIITLNSPIKTDMEKSFVYSLKPKVLIDNGVPTRMQNDSMYFADRFNMSHIILQDDKIIAFPDLNIQFFVPYKQGFNMDETNQNSISVMAGDLLYMSNCYGKCEEHVQAEAKKIVLANFGKCPTNSYKFIVDTKATTIYGSELCPDILTDAHVVDASELKEILGIEFVKVDGMVGTR